MVYKVFYSWQSDLPNNCNRGFIESAIEKALKSIKSQDEYKLEMTIDRDTVGTFGTPDIVGTIFSKIENTSLFIADISFINSNEKGRKCPNPNVLIELGYAAKCIGWDRILCIFNTDYGDIEDLPFDLRFRRPLAYSLKKLEKKKVRENLANIIESTILDVQDKIVVENKIEYYQKEEIDTQILKILGSISYIIFGYDREVHLYGENLVELLNIGVDSIKENILRSRFLGFQIFKDYEEIEMAFREIFNKLKASADNDNRKLEYIVDLIKWCMLHENFLREQDEHNTFIKVENDMNRYHTLNAKDLNPENKDGYILLEKLDETRSMVRDSGEFKTKPQKSNLLSHYIVNHSEVLQYSSVLHEFISIANGWFTYTDNKIIFESMKSFKFRTNKEASNLKTEKIFDYNSETIFDLLGLMQSVKLDGFIKYYDLIQLNFIMMLLNRGFIFSHQEELEKMIRTRAYGIKYTEAEEYNKISIIDPDDMEDLHKKKDKKGLELLESSVKGETELEYVYFGQNFTLFYNALIDCNSNMDLPESLRKSAQRLLNGINLNVNYSLEPLLKAYCNKYCSDGGSQLEEIVNQMYLDFQSKFIDQSHDMVNFKAEIGKCIGVGTTL